MLIFLGEILVGANFYAFCNYVVMMKMLIVIMVRLVMIARTLPQSSPVVVEVHHSLEQHLCFLRRCLHRRLVVGFSFGVCSGSSRCCCPCFLSSPPFSPSWFHKRSDFKEFRPSSENGKFVSAFWDLRSIQEHKKLHLAPVMSCTNSPKWGQLWANCQNFGKFSSRHFPGLG